MLSVEHKLHRLPGLRLPNFGSAIGSHDLWRGDVPMIVDISVPERRQFPRDAVKQGYVPFSPSLARRFDVDKALQHFATDRDVVHVRDHGGNFGFGTSKQRFKLVIQDAI